MATSKSDGPPSLGELVPSIIGKLENFLYDRAAKKAGYDPTSAYILGALTTDHNELANPQNALAPAYGFNGMTVGQIAERRANEQLLKDLLGHYGKRFGKPQRAGDGTDPPINSDVAVPIKIAPEQLRNMT